MADIQHSVLTGSEIHEPKGVDAANAEEVYVADGAGSGAWTKVFQYATIETIETDAVTVSGIGTTPITFPFTSNGESEGLTADATNNRITCSTAGVYYVDFAISFSTNAVGDAGLYEFKLNIDGTPSTHGMARQMSGSSDTGSGGFNAIVSVTAGQHLTIEVESDDGGNGDDIDLYFANLTSFKVG